MHQSRIDSLNQSVQSYKMQLNQLQSNWSKLIYFDAQLASAGDPFAASVLPMIDTDALRKQLTRKMSAEIQEIHIKT